MIFNYLGPIASVLFAAYVIGVILFVLLSDRPPVKTLAWILVLVAFPLFGVIIYIAFGRDWRKSMRRRPWFKEAQQSLHATAERLYKDFPDTSEQVREKFPDDPAPNAMVTMLDQTIQLNPLPVSDLKIYPTGQEHFDQLEKDIYSAEKFVHLEYFIWERDELTTRITDAILDRLKAGVEVRVMYDWAGSLAYKKDQLKLIEKAGAKVAADMMELTRINYRNHRKIAIIDGLIGYTGGMNMGQEYIDGKPHYPAWRDTQVRVTGPGLQLIQVPFAWRWLADTNENLFNEKYFFIPPGEHGTTMVQLATDGPDEDFETGHRSAMIGINEAQKRVWIQSPYFIPDDAMIYALQNAALRGVDVRFMMTGWPDKKTTYWAGQTYWKPMLEAGVRIFTWDTGFLHAKTFLFDDCVTGIGTMNFDMRSFFINQEMVLWTYDREVAARQAAIYENDLKESGEHTLETFKEMPAGQKIAGSVMRLASGIF